MISAQTVSQVFAGFGVAFGIGSIALLALRQPSYATPVAVLAVGSILASAIHAKA